MNEPQKRLDEANKGLMELLRQGTDNQTALRACKKHNFKVILGDPTLHVRCENCGGVLSPWSHEIYLMGIRNA
ncbi:MAG: hypothetical protein ACK5LG_21885 [Bacteroides thetaiotaomicron]